MSQSLSFVLSKEEALRLQGELWCAQAMLRLLERHAAALLTGPEPADLEGLPEVLRAIHAKVEAAADDLDPMNLPRPCQGGVATPNVPAPVLPFRPRGQGGRHA